VIEAIGKTGKLEIHHRVPNAPKRASATPSKLKITLNRFVAYSTQSIAAAITLLSASPDFSQAQDADLIFADGFEPPPAPAITSAPILIAEIGALYAYDVDANDPDGDPLTFSLSVAPAAMSIDANTGLIQWTPASTGTVDVTVEVTDNEDGSDQQAWQISVSEPSGSEPVPTEIDETVTTTFPGAVEFLFTGPDATQIDVEQGALVDYRVAVVRGTVLTRDGSPLSGVRVSALGQAGAGYTLTRNDGAYDLVVNGGGTPVIEFELADHLTAQRRLDLPWHDYRTLDPVRMVQLSSEVSSIDLARTDAPAALGEVESDGDGARQGVLVFQPGTTAEMALPNGDLQPLSTLDVRITEYTVGPNGPEAMPAELPPTTGYTYAAEFSVDEALAADATRVFFDPAAVFYLDNFLDFPVGTPVPLGGYDRLVGQWEAAPDGIVLQIVGINGSGEADIDFDGDGLADDPATIGMTSSERMRLASLYDVGAELWRAEIPHFSPWDCNWPFGPPEGAVAPRPEHAPNLGGFDPERDCSTFNFSRIDCQSQILRENIPLPGTAQDLHYRSDRALNYVGGRQLEVTIPDADIPEIATQVILALEVAGKKQRRVLAATGDIEEILTWDGRDVYGRTVYGPQPYELVVSFSYQANYSFASSGGSGGGGGGAGGGVTTSFLSQPGVEITGNLSRSVIVLSRKFSGILQGAMPASAAIGSWSLTDHHALSVEDGTLFKGNGDVVRDEDGVGRFIVKRFDAQTTGERSAFPMPDGSVLVGRRGNTGNGRVYRIEPDGTRVFFAGSSSAFASLDDGQNATFVRLPTWPDHLTALADGRVLVSQGRVVRSIDSAGIVDTVFGEDGFPGSLPVEDNLDYVGPANELQMTSINDIATGPGGSFFVIAAETNAVSPTIWQVTPEGTAYRIAGNALGSGQLDGSPALLSEIDATHLAVAENGDIYFSERFQDQVWKISGGVLERAVGTGSCSGDWMAEGPALSTELCDPGNLAIGPDGTLFIASAFQCQWPGCGLNTYTQRIYAYDGARIEIIAGGFNVGLYTEGGFALGNQIGNRDGDLHVTEDGALLYETETGTEDIFLIQSPLTGLIGLGVTDIPFPSRDGRYIYLFDRQGRHLRTNDTFLQRDIVTFAYDGNGQLASLTDVYGRSTTVDRNSSGAITGIIGPDGHRTDLTATSGELSELTDPAGNTHQFTYDPTIGAMDSHTDPRGNASTYTYDPVGRLVQATNRGGGTITLERNALGIDEFEVVETRRGTEVTRYRLERDGTSLVKTVTDPTGATRVVVRRADGTTEGAFPDGTTAVYRERPDPRFGLPASRVFESTIETPGGSKTTQSHELNVTYSDPEDVGSVTEWEELLTRNGRTSRLHYDVATRSLTYETAEGRLATQVFDEFGRIVSEDPPGPVAPTFYAYDAAGRLTSITKSNESVTIAYDSNGHPISATDSTGAVTTWTNDANGRLLSTSFPSGRVVTFSRDGNENPTAVTPPESETHQLGYDENDRLISYTLPEASPLFLNLDGFGRREGVEYRDGSARQNLFQNALPLGSLMPRSTLNVGHASEVAGTGQTENINFLAREPDMLPAQAMDVELDGRLVTALEFTGPLAARVEYTYSTPDRMTARTLNSEPAIGFAYDDDNLITATGPFNWSREVTTGLLSTIGDGTLLIDIALDARANLTQRTVAHGATTVHDMTLTRNDRGQITTRISNLDSSTAERRFSYDADGRLIEVRDGADILVEEFTYDGNGNRLSHTTGSGVSLASYDSQDRLINRDGISYTYDSNGFLSARGLDSFDYTVDGVLRSAIVGGLTVDFAYDFMGRRVARTDSGGTTAYVYGNLDHPFRITASIAPDTTVTEYYYDDAGFLFAFQRGGSWYYVGTDPVGSPRVVIDAASGAIVKTIEYSAFGEVLTDSDPAFRLPVGYAGGLSDSLTDLVRFGFRDYEPASGRFVGLDPLLLAGGTTNLYVYVTNDPINFRDISGLLIKIGGSGYAGLGGGASVTFADGAISVCVEGGAGFGGGFGIEPATIPRAGFSAVLAGGFGPFGTGLEVPFDECWANGVPTLGWDGFSYAPPSLEDVPSSPAERAKNTLKRARKGIDHLPQNRSIGQKLGRAINPAAALSAEASLTLRGCFPPITW